MTKFIISGGQPLMGAVRLGGAKNAGFKLMIAAALGEKQSRLLNLSYINDVEMTFLTLRKLGVKIKRCGERTVYLDPNSMKTYKLPRVAGRKTRGSTLFAAMLLAKRGRAVIPLPGGCILGARPVNRHLEALKSLGVKVDFKGEFIHLRADKLKASKYKFPKKTHTGTEAMIIASVRAQGKTEIVNAGQEPEIDDLIAFLNKMGAKIKRVGGDRIVIQGVKKLGGAIHQVMPDRNEAVSYAIAALATKGDIVVENAVAEHLKAFLAQLKRVGGRYQVLDFGIRFWYEQPLLATDLETKPAPGFMTDWQPLWATLMTQAEGVSRIIERVHNNRFQYIRQLEKMGAKVELYSPQVDNPKQYYQFDNPGQNQAFHAVKIHGPIQLKGAEMQVTDLRAGATLTIAALTAQGQSILSGVEHIDRGYEKLDKKLKQLGARIERRS